MTFIIAIIAIIFYISLSSRLSSVEHKLKQLNGEVAPKPHVSTTTLHQPDTVVPKSVPAQAAVSAHNSGIDERAGGKLLAAVGIIAVFLGLAFFLKYAFDNNLITVMGRVILGYATGILAMVLGVSLRKKYTDYADTLTGGGIAVLYLTTFSAYVFYSLISSTTAYFILVITAAASVALSVALESQALVILGIIGAYVTPMIMSIHKADTVSLFSYLLIINIGNVAIAYWYKWTRLNLVGIIGTFILSFLWFTTRHIPDSERVLVFLFHSLYFGMYLIAGLMHHSFRKQNSDEADALFVALNGLLYAGIGYNLLYPLYPDSMGIFMLVIALVYGFTAFISYETNRADKLMNAILPALSALFLTIAIPIHFDGPTIPVLWLTEALLMFFIEYAVRGKNLYVYGTIVYCIALLNLITLHLGLPANFVVFANERFMIFAYAAFAAYLMAYIASLDSKRGPHETANGVKVFMAILAEAVTLIAITMETNSYFDDGSRTSETANVKNTAVSIVWILYATVLTIIGFAGRYKTLRIGGLILFFLTAFKIFGDLWVLGPVYRIIASIIFGVVALAASFAYSKFKDRLFHE